ncbi:MAG TPA: GatB/YqeY domain-containing protein [Anaerolineaceae bacterium]
MGLKAILENSLKEAMKSGDQTRKQTIRLVLSAIRLAQVEKGDELNELEIINLVQKEIKSRRESIQDAEKANRIDLVENAKDEIAVLESFLPKQMDEEELSSIISAAIVETKASTPADMGKVMKIVIPIVAGRAPNDKISQIVRRLLTK